MFVSPTCDLASKDIIATLVARLHFQNYELGISCHYKKISNTTKVWKRLYYLEGQHSFGFILRNGWEFRSRWLCLILCCSWTGSNHKYGLGSNATSPVAIMVSFSLNQPSLNNLLVIFLHNMQHWDSLSWGQTWLTHLPMTIINNKPNVQTYNKLKIVKVFDGFSDLLQSCSVIFFFTQLFVHHILWNTINRKLLI